MAKILTIDKGNSSAKMAVWDGDSLLEVKTAESRSILPTAIRLVGTYGVDSAILCSVSGDIGGLDEAMACCGVALERLSAATPMPIAIEYATPETLGADRIAAAVGARSMFGERDVLIVDIGTAVTYDRLTADGRFVGGNIAPGVGMRLRALHAFTKKLPAVKSAGDVPQWGYSTETAMRAGAIRGVIGEIGHYRSLLPEGAVTVLTGGWGADIAAMLGYEVEVNNQLVTLGLNRIMQYGAGCAATARPATTARTKE